MIVAIGELRSTFPVAAERFLLRSSLDHQLTGSDGGIAQLVERQLCKLEVRGSNPLASKAHRVEAKV